MQTAIETVLSKFQSGELGTFRENISGKKLTTFAIGGPIRLLAEPDSAEQAAAILYAADQIGNPVHFLGAGSNVLLPDVGVADLTIKAGRGLRYVLDAGAGNFEVGAAMSLMTLSRSLSQQGFAGLEFAGGIPASIGGAVRMNAGAHGGEMADILQEVQLALPGGTVCWLPAVEFCFSYRHSVVPDGAMITAARIRLRPETIETTAARRAEYLAERKKRQPLTQPSAGSVFKNPVAGGSAGYLIEQAGLRGHSIGGASVSEMHGNWIVNIGRRATAADVLGLISLCQHAVERDTGIQLEPEIVRWNSPLK